MAGWRTFLKAQLLKRGMIVSRPPGQFNIGPIKMRAIAERGLKLSMIVDGGAADGGFAREIRGIYPDAQVLCIEPRDESMEHLKRLAGELSGITVAQTLVGDQQGEVEFYEQLDSSSMLADKRGTGAKIKRPITTIDLLLEQYQLPSPDLIKLDLQGAELLALRGATRALSHAQAVELEASFIPLYEGQPLFAEIVEFMSTRGFRLYDILALWHRPLDGALAQGDFFFLREGHPLLADSRWSNETKQN